MYNPREFREERVEVLHEFVRRERFAVLVTMGREGLEASHIPMAFDAAQGPLGKLRAHIARGNPQWRETNFEVPALAIFQGPHHYISPSWYPSREAGGRVVPTWNYAVVHAHGRLRAVEDREWLRKHVEELVAREEEGFDKPWSAAEAPADYIDGMLKGIVGLEMTIERLEGKWKMGQNRMEADREGAIAGLRAAGAVEVAEWMERCRKGPAKTGG